MENKHTTKEIFSGALLLTIAGLISKILSAGYRIPLQNITGDVGFYIYQQIYPFIGMTMMLSVYGFPMAISKVVSELRDEKRELSIPSFYLPVALLLSICSGAMFLFLFINSDWIASWMGDSKLSHSLTIVAFAFLLIPLTSLIRGVFQGVNNMRPTAIAQIVDQIVRVTIIIFVAILVTREGWNLYEVGTGAALASIIGATTSFVLLLLIWLLKRSISFQSYRYNWFTYFNSVVVYGLLIGINHMALLFFQLSDAFTLMPNLMDYGYNEDEAKIWKGVFDRGYPLIQLGTVVGSSLAMAFIPSITKKRMEKDPQQFQLHIQSMVKFSFYLAIGATVGLMILFPHVNILLFQDDRGSLSLTILSSTILFASLAITIASILQGLGYVTSTAIFIVVTFFIKCILNSLLVAQYGIVGSSLSTVTSAICLLLLNLIYLKKVMPTIRIFTIPRLAPFASLLTMALFLFIAKGWLFNILQVDTRVDYLCYVLVTVIFGGLVYFVCLVIGNGFRNDELQALPFGRVIVEMKRWRNKHGKFN